MGMIWRTVGVGCRVMHDVAGTRNCLACRRVPTLRRRSVVRADVVVWLGESEAAAALAGNVCVREGRLIWDGVGECGLCGTWNEGPWLPNLLDR